MRKTKIQRPQRRDPEWSTRCFLIEDHYNSIAEQLDWDVNRYDRLCAALKLNRIELGAFLRLTPNLIRSYISRRRFPKPIELHLTLIERSIFYSSKPPVFPSL